MPTQSSPHKDGSEGVPGEGGGEWREIWRCEIACPVIYLRFSPDGAFFATAGEVSYLFLLASPEAV